jgi:hypothetical protein
MLKMLQSQNYGMQQLTKLKGSMCTQKPWKTTEIHSNICSLLWGDFPSLYSRFYKVIMHGSTNATNEGRIQM